MGGELADQFQFFESDALLYRLTAALTETDKEVVFVVGAPLSAPFEGAPGVADVNGVIDLIRREFSASPPRLARLDKAILSGENKYQAAFDFLYGHAGQDAANRVIRKAVIQALGPKDAENKLGQSLTRLSDNELSAIDKDASVWSLNPGLEALGALLARYPSRFGSLVVTSNFDPLIEVAIRRHDGAAWRTSLTGDGSIFLSSAPGSQVIHIHGYWHSSDTLHTQRQLLRQRPTLLRDLQAALHNKLVVVMAYGGWPDVFTGALEDIIHNETLLPEVLWAFYGNDPNIPPHLTNLMERGLERGRITLYKGVDCHQFLPALYEEWDNSVSVEDTLEPLMNKSIQSVAGIASDERPLFKLAPLECDRPPNIDVWVGRETELRALETSKAKVVILCGLGGEGKSVLASYYVSNLDEQGSVYRFWDWRDCKEQSDRIRTQLSEMIIRLSNESFTSEALAELTDADLVEVVVSVVRRAKAVLVFDNVDSYVDLENRVFTGLLHYLVTAFSTSDSDSRLLLTCRPEISYPSASIITIKVTGISVEETAELFEKRVGRISIPIEDIEEVHRQTHGHAFELDLIASKINNDHGITIRKLLENMRRGRDGRPDVLSSIWDELALREQTVLRYLAEALRPETEDTLQKFCSAKLTQKNFSRALVVLIKLNLLVVKQEEDSPDLYDLHPLVRHFVKTKFERDDRTSFIKSVLHQYESIIGIIGSLMGINLPYVILERWSQKVELQVYAGLYEAAFDTLINVEDAMIGGGHLQEYARVARLLFESIGWETASVKYKQFDKVFATFVIALQNLDDNEPVDRLLDRYAETVPQKTARFIHLCDLRGYIYWLRGNFEEAIEWASRGDTLKEESQVDTLFDCKHTLALAQRDAGNPAEALSYFLKGHDVDELLAEDDTPMFEATTYGNVGRCLHLEGRLDEALICYRRSMRLLEDQTYATANSNRAYARRWTGQVILTLGQPQLAAAFFIDGIRILGGSAPSRIRELCADLDLARQTDTFVMSETSAARSVRAWVRG